MPAELADTLIVLTWNDAESFSRVMAERGDEVAAVITEPVMFNTGCVLPEPGYLELLRQETQQHGALLIFDEVITGFRFARGGAQEFFGVTPDLTTLAKGLGGGFPVAAIGGSSAVMSMIAEGRYSHSGTYNANVVACAAVSATMDVLAEPGLFERQRELGEALMRGLRKLAADAGLPVIVEGLGTVFQLWFSEHPIRNWRDAQRYAERAALHPVVAGDAAARRLVPPEPVREPLRVAGALQRRRQLHAGCGRAGICRDQQAAQLGVADPLWCSILAAAARYAADAAGEHGPPGPGSGLLYQQVVSYIEQLVSERGLAPGDMLPTHAELAELTGVSLITVRRALDELERAGKVRRHQGLGTFLARPRIVTEPTRAGSLLGTLAADGAGRGAKSLDTRILAMRRGLPSADIARALQIWPDSQVWQLRRQRRIDGEPAVVETSIIPVALAPELDRLVSDLPGSLYDLLGREYGLEDEYEEQYLEVIMPTQEERRLLSIPPRTQVVRIRGLSMDKAGTPFDCFEQLYPAAEFAFAISGSTSRHLLPTPGFQDWDVRPLPGEPGPAPRGPAAPGGQPTGPEQLAHERERYRRLHRPRPRHLGAEGRGAGAGGNRHRPGRRRLPHPPAQPRGLRAGAAELDHGGRIGGRAAAERGSSRGAGAASGCRR